VIEQIIKGITGVLMTLIHSYRVENNSKLISRTLLSSSAGTSLETTFSVHA